MNPVISIKPSTMSDRDKPAVDPVAAPTPVPTMKPMAVAPPSAAATTAGPPQIAFDIQDLSIFYGAHQAIKNVSLQITAHSVTAIIGPSGCGKSTLLRSLNRMHELTPGARHTGSIRILGDDLYGPGIDPTVVRRRVGMIFQKSNPFPTLTIAENVLVGLRLNGVRDKVFLGRRLEESLRMAALWDEVKDHLHRPGTSLSGGQQQRLCIARAIANRPEILLMDEPCSALDPIATGKVEELIHELSRDYTIVIVTHNMQQAARVSNKTAFMYMGKLVEYGETEQIFMNPKDPQTEAYVSGRFG
jgi:phosphate transport system ATP-binding protein